MERLAPLLVCCLAAWLSLAEPAAARRVALSIGVGGYAHAEALANPPNDARLVARSLRAAGFDSVDELIDPDMAGLQAALRRFAAQAQGADVAVIYFAGHGLEARAQNWLLPQDVALRSEADLDFGAIRLESVLRALDGAHIRVVALDACRDNPFAERVRRPDGALPRGLTSVEADNVLLMYAAAAGEVATDGAGSANSPFAVALSRRLQETDVDLRVLGGRVRDDVVAATAGVQRPFVASSLPGETLSFSGRRSAVGAPASRPPPRNTPGAYDVTSSLDFGAWRVVLATPELSSTGEERTIAQADLIVRGEKVLRLRCDAGGAGDSEVRTFALLDFRQAGSPLSGPTLVVDGDVRPFENTGILFVEDRPVTVLLDAVDSDAWRDIVAGVTLAVASSGKVRALPLPAETGEVLGNVLTYCRAY